MYACVFMFVSAADHTDSFCDLPVAFHFVTGK